MITKSVYPVIATRRLAISRDFYVQYLGFSVSFENDWYVSLYQEGNPSHQIAFLDPWHRSVPEAHRGAETSGILVNIEVEDVDQLWQFASRHLPRRIRQDIRDEPWGQRHFLLEDPNGLLVDVIKVIPPCEEFLTDFLQIQTVQFDNKPTDHLERSYKWL